MDSFVRNRLHAGSVISSGDRSAFALGLMLFVFLLSGCDTESNPLAAYEGERPLILRRITQSATSDIQWVGGRVAAVGVNRGERAALDETLVWIRRADGNEISSHVTVGEGGDADFVRTVGGEPIERLSDAETYTFWLAEEEAFAAALDSTQLNAFTFTDTTLTMKLFLLGRPGGGEGVVSRIARNERLSGTEFVLTWTPEDAEFRQLAIRAAGTGGFTNLVWHVVVPDEVEEGITSPVTLGVAPEGTLEAVEFTGFQPSTYTLWMVTEDWNGTFGIRTPGYVFFTILSTNFEEEEEEGEQGEETEE